MNKLTKALPVISIGLVVLSFLNLHLYYKNFGIDIQNYLDVSEIIFSLTTFLPGVAMILFVGLVIFITIPPKDDRERQSKQTGNKLYQYFKSHRNRRLRILARFSTSVFFAALFVLCAVIAMIAFMPSILTEDDILQTTDRFDFYLFIIVVGISFPIAAMAAAIKGIDVESETASYFAIGVIFFASIGALSYRGIVRSNLILNGQPKYEVEFKTLQTTYFSNDSTRYVGSIRNFHFLYDVGRKENIVIPVGDVIEARFRKIRTGL